MCVCVYMCVCMHACICKWTVEQQEFELHGSTYVNFFHQIHTGVLSDPNLIECVDMENWLTVALGLLAGGGLASPTPMCSSGVSCIYICVCVHVCACVCVCVCVWDRFSFNFQNQLYTVGTIVLQFIDTETELENSVGHPKSHTRWNTQSHPSCTEKVDNVKEKPP